LAFCLLLTPLSLPALALFISLSKVRRRLKLTEACLLSKRDIMCADPLDSDCKDMPKWRCELQGRDAAASLSAFVTFDGLEESKLDSEAIISGVTTLLVDGAEVANGILEFPEKAKKEYSKKEKPAPRKKPKKKDATEEDSQTKAPRKPEKNDDTKGGKDKKGGRVLVSETRQVLAVRVIANDRSTTSSLSEMSDKIFGTNADTINLVERYDSCSYGQLVMEPYRGTTEKGFNVEDGVVEVVIDMNVNGVNDGGVRDAARAAATDILGDLSSQFDHVMFCLPPGTAGNWIAYGKLFCRKRNRNRRPLRLILFFFPHHSVRQFVGFRLQ
jgi:hypothetical protein